MVDSGDLAEANKEKKGMEQAATEPLAAQKIAQTRAEKVDKDLEQEEQQGPRRRDAPSARPALAATGAQAEEHARARSRRSATKSPPRSTPCYQTAQDNVKKRLAELETQSMKRFDDGNAQAAKEFEDNVNRELEAYKDDRYSGWFGWARKAKDWLLGMDELPEVKAIFDRNRADVRRHRSSKLVDDITADNERVIRECKEELARREEEDRGVRRRPRARPEGHRQEGRR